MKKLLAGAVTAALISGLGPTGPTQARATPLPIVASSAIAPDATLTQIKYKARKKAKRHHVRRHYRRGNNAVAAAALGLFGAALAGAIASSRYDDDYYYARPGYYPGYYPGYSYGYVAPRAYYAPAWRGGHRWVGRAGGWRGGARFSGGWHHGGGFRGGGFRGGIRHHR
jgi:hypothetical protein